MKKCLLLITLLFTLHQIQSFKLSSLGLGKPSLEKDQKAFEAKLKKFHEKRRQFRQDFGSSDVHPLSSMTAAERKKFDQRNAKLQKDAYALIEMTNRLMELTQKEKQLLEKNIKERRESLDFALKIGRITRTTYQVNIKEDEEALQEINRKLNLYEGIKRLFKNINAQIDMRNTQY